MATFNGDKRIICQSYSHADNAVDVRSCKNDCLLVPEDSYTTYKSKYRCRARHIFERFSVPLGSLGTSNVRDRFQRSTIFEVSRSIFESRAR